MNNYNRLLTKFEAFDAILAKRKAYYTIYLFGAGLGIYHLKEDYRASNDLDYMSQEMIDDEDTKFMLDALEINNMFGIMQVPELSDIIIIDKINYRFLTVLIPSIENFALSKLLSNRLKDYNDLENYPILDNCNLKKLRSMLDEYLPYTIFEDNPNYCFNYLDDLLEKRNLL